MHRKTWYTVCVVVMAMSLLYRLHIMVKRVYYTGLWIHWFPDRDATIPNGTVTIGQTSLIGVGHSGSDPIVPLMLFLCNGWGTSIVLQFSWDSINNEKG